MTATTVILPSLPMPLEFPNGLDYEINSGVLTIETETETRHYAPGAWLEVRDHQ